MSERDREAIGERGERIAANLLTRFTGMARPLFRPRFLGDKWPTSDLYVELEQAPAGIRPFFFAQVKSTGEGYNNRSGDLKVRLGVEHVTRLLWMPGPTYFIGVDEQKEVGYICSVHDPAKRSFPTLPTRFRINRPVRERLHEEVLRFWLAQSFKPKSSQFTVQ